MTPTININPYFTPRLDWIEQHNMEFEVVSAIIDYKTLYHLPSGIRFKREQDYTWYMLRWGS